MSLRVEDFEGFHEANNITELESVLVKRYNEGSNSLWLSYGSKSHPALALLVRGDVAGIHYFPKDSHPGRVAYHKKAEGGPSYRVLVGRGFLSRPVISIQASRIAVED